MRDLPRSTVALALLLLPSCVPIVPPPEVILAGQWEYFRQDGFQVVLTFDADGQLARMVVNRPDGASSNLDFEDSATSLDAANNVRVAFTLDDGERLFNGILTTENNALDGTLNREIRLSGDTLVLPSGSLTFQRITGN